MMIGAITQTPLGDAGPRRSNRLASRRRRRGVLLTVLILAVVLTGTPASAQSTQEIWPEVDVWWRMSPEWRTSVFVPISRNLDTNYREGNLIIQGDYVWGERPLQPRLMDENHAQKMNAFMIRGGYLGGRSLDDHGDAYTERTMFAELHVRKPIKGGVLLQSRLRTDVRWLAGSGFSRRWRYRLQAEKEVELRSTSIVPYMNVEPYYDSRYGTVNRVRLITGTSVAVSPLIAVEGNVTYQHDSRLSAKHLTALNVILHLYFETAPAR